MPDSSKTFFLIVGFQRSGTSSVAQLLDNLGVYFGDPSHFIDPEKFTHNPIFYELQWIINFNDRVLATWDMKNPDFILPIESEFQRPEVVSLREPLKQSILEEFGDRPLLGAKDPRLCFTFPIWREVLTEMGYAIKIIQTIRSASAIFKSNRALKEGRLSRWQRYYVRHILAARYFFRDFPVCYFDYDLLMQDPAGYSRKKAAELNLAMPDPVQATRHLVRDHYHHQPDDTGTGEPWVDRVDADLRAGRLDPNEYLAYRSISNLVTEEMQHFLRESPHPWLTQYKQIMDLLSPGGHFVAERQPNGRLDIRRL